MRVGPFVLVACARVIAAAPATPATAAPTPAPTPAATAAPTASPTQQGLVNSAWTIPTLATYSKAQYDDYLNCRDDSTFFGPDNRKCADYVWATNPLTGYAGRPGESACSDTSMMRVTTCGPPSSPAVLTKADWYKDKDNNLKWLIDGYNNDAITVVKSDNPTVTGTFDPPSTAGCEVGAFYDYSTKKYFSAAQMVAVQRACPVTCGMPCSKPPQLTALAGFGFCRTSDVGSLFPTSFTYTGTTYSSTVATTVTGNSRGVGHKAPEEPTLNPTTAGAAGSSTMGKVGAKRYCTAESKAETAYDICYKLCHKDHTCSCFSVGEFEDPAVCSSGYSCYTYPIWINAYTKTSDNSAATDEARLNVLRGGTLTTSPQYYPSRYIQSYVIPNRGPVLTNSAPAELARLLEVPRVSKENCHNIIKIIEGKDKAKPVIDLHTLANFNYNSEYNNYAAMIGTIRSHPLLNQANCVNAYPYLKLPVKLPALKASTRG